MLGLLDLGDLVDMLQAHCSHNLFARVRCTPFLPTLSNWSVGCIEEEPGGLRCSDVEVKCPVGTNRYSDWQRGAGCDVLGSGIELLDVICQRYWGFRRRETEQDTDLS